MHLVMKNIRLLGVLKKSPELNFFKRKTHKSEMKTCIARLLLGEVSLRENVLKSKKNSQTSKL